MLLTTKGAAEAAIKGNAQRCQMVAEDFRLADAGGRKYVVIIGAKRSLAMSNQIDAAHVRS